MKYQRVLSPNTHVSKKDSMKIMALGIAMLLCPLAVAAQTVSSPNGNVKVTFALTDNGVPTYEMSYKDKAVVKRSRLGLELAKDKHASKGKNETDLMDGFKVTSTNSSSFDETWTPV